MINRCAQAALDKGLETLALAEQRWKGTAKAWLRPAGEPWPAGHDRLNLRAVAERAMTDADRTERRASYLATGQPSDAHAESLTEEHHAIVDLGEIDADQVGATLVTALGELAAIVIPPLRQRLVRAGVLERPPSVIGPGVIVPR